MTNVSLDTMDVGFAAHDERMATQVAEVFAAFHTIAEYSRSDDFDRTVVAKAAASERMHPDALTALMMQYLDWEVRLGESDGTKRP